MSANLGRWITATAVCGSLVLAGAPAHALDDGPDGTSLTIVAAATSGDGYASDAAPAKPKKKKLSSASAAKSAATAASAPGAEPVATASASAPEAQPGAAIPAASATTATAGTAIQPLTPIALPTPEPSALSTAPVWPRPDAERRADATAAKVSAGFGQPIELTRVLTRGGATLGAMLVAGGLALAWARSRRTSSASADPSRDRLTVVSSRALAPRRSVHLVEVDGVRILVGLDAERIVPLALVPTPPRAAEAAATAPVRTAPRPAPQPVAVAAAAGPRPAPQPTAQVPLIDERNPVTVDVPELLGRAARTSATRAPDPAALLSLTNSLKRHLRGRANGNGNGNGNGHGSVA